MLSPGYHQVLPSTEYGGAAEIAFRLTEHAHRQAGRNSYLWLPGQGRAWQKALDEKLNVLSYPLPDIVHASRTRSTLANLRAGWRWRPYRPGILHLHSAELYGGLPLACALSQMQRVVHIHLEQEASTIRWAFRRAPELIITCAKFLVENVRRFLPERQQEKFRIVAVPNCIDTSRYFPGDRTATKVALGAAPDVPLAIMLANLSPHKGQETAVRAIALLKQQGQHVDCWLAGVDRQEQGDYTSRLKSLIHELNVADRIKLLGYRSDGPELMRAADLFLLPSTREGLPLSVLEAQASHVPVLAAPTSGIPEVVQDGKTGFLIPANDPAGYAFRMAELLQQPALCESVVTNAGQQVRDQHRVDVYCERIWELYKQLLTGASIRSASKAALI